MERSKWLKEKVGLQEMHFTEAFDGAICIDTQELATILYS